MRGIQSGKAVLHSNKPLSEKKKHLQGHFFPTFKITFKNQPWLFVYRMYLCAMHVLLFIHLLAHSLLQCQTWPSLCPRGQSSPEYSEPLLVNSSLLIILCSELQESVCTVKLPVSCIVPGTWYVNLSKYLLSVCTHSLFQGLLRAKCLACIICNPHTTLQGSYSPSSLQKRKLRFWETKKHAQGHKLQSDKARI